jgi:hypothetical protein
MTTLTIRLTKDSITIIGATRNAKKYSSANPENAWFVDTRSGTSFYMCQKLQVPFWEETYFLK